MVRVGAVSERVHRRVERFVTGEQRQTIAEEELQIPEGDPDCPTCRRTLELIHEAIEELGRLQQERLRDEQRTRELNAQIEELKGRASGAAAKPGRRLQSRRQKRRRR